MFEGAWRSASVHSASVCGKRLVRNVLHSNHDLSHHLRSVRRTAEAMRPHRPNTGTPAHLKRCARLLFFACNTYQMPRCIAETDLPLHHAACAACPGTARSPHHHAAHAGSDARCGVLHIPTTIHHCSLSVGCRSPNHRGSRTAGGPVGRARAGRRQKGQDGSRSGQPGCWPRQAGHRRGPPRAGGCDDPADAGRHAAGAHAPRGQGSGGAGHAGSRRRGQGRQQRV